MTNLGLGVLINMLSSNEESVEKLKAFKGKELTGITLKDDTLSLYSGEEKISFWDNGQSCCESRYMVCDDKLEEFVGATFLGAEVADGSETSGGYDCHEVQFLRINTSKGDIVVSNHNEHNGYYGGFSLTVS